MNLPSHEPKSQVERSRCTPTSRCSPPAAAWPAPAGRPRTLRRMRPARLLWMRWQSPPTRREQGCPHRVRGGADRAGGSHSSQRKSQAREHEQGRTGNSHARQACGRMLPCAFKGRAGLEGGGSSGWTLALLP